MTTPRQIGKYQVLGEIASGGQGAVYRGFDSSTAMIVAVKVLHQQHPGNESFVVQACTDANQIGSFSP